jgi:hypothetical protein
MFELFRQNFSVDQQVPGRGLNEADTDAVDDTFTRFMREYSGCSFNQGVYRIIRSEDVKSWTALVADAFPSFRGRILCFGFDWMGDVFALDASRRVDGEPMVLLMEPGTGEALEIPRCFVDFHDVELVEDSDAALNATNYIRWLDQGYSPPTYGQCVGYKTPLFLGGKDDFNNMHATDMRLYWEATGQILNQVRELPPDTEVSFRIS